MKTMIAALLLIVCATSASAASVSAAKNKTARPAPAGNLVRNGAFKYGMRFNGAAAWFSSDGRERYISSQGGRAETGFCGWHILGDGTYATNSAPFGNAIALKGQCTLLNIGTEGVPNGNYVLRFLVRGDNIKGKARIVNIGHSGNPGWRYNETRLHAVDLPENTGGEWQVCEAFGALESEDRLFAGVEFSVGKDSSAEIAEVELYAMNAEPREFEPARDEWLEVTLGDWEMEKFPRFSAGDKTVARVRNASGKTLDGTLELYNAPWSEWNKADFSLKPAATGEVTGWQPGKTKDLPIDLTGVDPNAFVAAAAFKDASGATIVPVAGIFKADKVHTASGGGAHQMLARNGLRYGVFPAVKPDHLFGVGNMMVGEGQYGGYQIDDFVQAREWRFSTLYLGTKEESLFFAAVAGTFAFSGMWIEYIDASKKYPYANPASKRFIDIFNPEGRGELARIARAQAALYAEGPGFSGSKLANENTFFNGSTMCPSDYADAAFREWCRKRYGRISRLNEKWSTEYKGWGEVHQVVSKAEAEKSAVDERTGAAAADWMSKMGNLNDFVLSLMEKNPARAMDWMRWRVQASKDYIIDYINIAQRGNDALFGNNNCWPNFWPQILMDLYHLYGAPMLDQTYGATGLPRALGNTDEMIDMLEMTESVIKGRQMWGAEIYVQPVFPPEFAALQNWGMLAHGMTVNMLFAWKPYSDWGQVKDLRAWEKTNAPPIWCLMDKDGTKLPAYYTGKRSADEISAFHAKYDGLSFERLPRRVAWYVGDDQANANVFDSKDRPFNSQYNNRRISMAAILRMSGITMRYVNDRTLDELTPGKYDLVIVPPTPVLCDAAAERFKKYAKSGGKLIVCGPTGAYDEWRKPRATLGGWDDLGVALPEAWRDYHAFKGSAISGNMISDWKELPPMKDAEKIANVGVKATHRQWGKGEIFWFADCPSRYGFNQWERPLKNWVRGFIAATGIKRDAWWQDDLPLEKAWISKAVGTGTPYVEVVLRRNPAGRILVCVLNLGGAGSGTVVLPGFNGATLSDVIGGGNVTLTGDGLHLELPAIGYRIFITDEKFVLRDDK